LISRIRCREQIRGSQSGLSLPRGKLRLVLAQLATLPLDHLVRAMKVRGGDDLDLDVELSL